MQILITHGGLKKTRSFMVSRWQLGLGVSALVLTLLMLSGTVYHFVFLKAASEGWPVVSQLVRLVVRDEIAQRDRFMRDNLDAMAQKVGEMQARLVQLESMGERVQNLAGVKADDLKGLSRPATAGSAPAAPRGPGGQGGPYVPLEHPSLDQLRQAINALDEQAEQRADLLTLSESRLMESRLRALMVPNSRPIEGAALGSGFGFRSDPFTGRAALHTGQDFSADVGTPILAAAGGVVVSTDFHPQYGHLLEIDHGNGLSTRYAHTSRYLVKVGDLVKRGQPVAQVGTSGRSTGPHLHFEVVVDGVPQDPAKFLGAVPAPLPAAVALAGRPAVSSVASAGPASAGGTPPATPPAVRPSLATPAKPSASAP